MLSVSAVMRASEAPPMSVIFNPVNADPSPVKDVAVTTPLTSNAVLGVSVPIPISPVLVIIIRVVDCVCNTISPEPLLSVSAVMRALEVPPTSAIFNPVSAEPSPVNDVAVTTPLTSN